MAFFQFKPSPLPENVHICTSENTPQLTTIKILLIVSIVVGFLMPIISIITFGFAFFYLSKHSLRMRTFKIFTLYVIACFLFAFALFGFIVYVAQSSTFKEFNMVVLVGIFASSIIFYLYWHLNKELSFITHEPLFFTAAKFAIIGGVVTAVSLGIAFGLWTEDISEDMLLSALVPLCSGQIVSLVMYIVAIFRFKYIIAYGENPQTNHS